MSYQDNPFIPQMLSPTAYEIGRFGKTPASHFYGLPNIAIPLTEVRAKGLSLPISLSYNAGGNKPDQYPGWVGLGWSLNAGGSIVRVINGMKDEMSVVQTNDYYPYGDLFEEIADGQNGSANRFLFTGKELCTETGLHDFSARFMQSRFGRFTTIDPLAEKYPGISPYAYCNGNPVNFVDPDGMESWRLDRSGYLHKTEGNDNRIYATDRDGNQSTDYLEISNADIVDSLSNTKEFVRGNGKKVQISSVVSKSDIDDLFKIFLFAANNTDVEWALHRGQDNNYLLGTSHHKDSVDDYTILAGDDNAPLPISSVHSHPNTLDVLTMGYHIDTYYGSDQWKVNNNQASRYNYVYFPKSTSLYLAGEYNPVYIKHIRIYNNFYFGTLNHK